MKDDMLKIGEMAKLNKISIPTLRLYDEYGLLKPIYTDPETNYRYYNIRQNARLDMIQYMKELGMSLNEIKSILDKKDLRLIESTLVQKKQQVKEEISQLELRNSALSRAIESLEWYRQSPKPGLITIEYIPERRIYAMHTDINFYDHDISVYEHILSDLKNNIIANGLPQIYYCNAGTTLDKANFLKRNYDSNEIFIFVDENFPDNHNTRIIERSMYACIYLNKFEDEIPFANRLLDYCHSNNMNIAGDYICEVMSEFNVFDSEERTMFLRLQVPITFR